MPSEAKMTARCLFCSLGCPVQMEGQGPGSLRPVYEPDGSAWGLCPRGHLITELIDHPKRLVEPSPSDAIAQLGRRLRGSRVAVIVDGHYPCEALAATAELTAALGQGSKCCIFLPPVDDELLCGLEVSGAQSSPLDALESADALVILGDPFVTQPVASHPIMRSRQAHPRMPVAVLDAGTVCCLVWFVPSSL